MSIKVVLLSTSPDGACGSMTRYANLTKNALKELSSQEKIKVDILNLAMPLSVLNRFPGFIRNWIHHAWIYIHARTIIAQYPADLFHILDGSNAYLIRHIHGIPVVVTVHDVIPWLQIAGKHGFPSPGIAGQWLIKKNIKYLKHANHIIACSINTMQDLYQIDGFKNNMITVIHPSLPKKHLQYVNRNNIEKYVIRTRSATPFILHIGNDAFYKNREGVIRIFARVHKKNPLQRLKMVGSKPSSYLINIIKKLGIEKYIDFISNSTDEELMGLYSSAELLLFPSIYEGFGWPPIEAMAYGCPVVCSNEASLPEVVGDAALMAPSKDERTLANYCNSIISDIELAEKLIRKGYDRTEQFSQEEMAKRMIALNKKIISKLH